MRHPLDWLLRLAVPKHDRPAVLGDLSEEYERRVRPQRSWLGAHAWYVGQLSAAVGFALIGRMRQLNRAVATFRLEAVWQDLRYGVRSLRKSPGFTAVAILTLGLGIGANTAIFSAVNGILIEHLPYADASRLLIIRREQAAYDVSFAEARAIEQQCPAIERVALYSESYTVVAGDVMRLDRWSSSVSADFFSMMGVAPVLGRYIVPEDTRPGSPPVAVFSYHLWMDGFGGDPHILGRDVVVDKDHYTVIGVMPKAFDLGVDWEGDSTEGLWMPLVEVPSAAATLVNSGGSLIARVKAGVPLSEAQVQIREISPSLAKRFRPTAQGTQLVADSPKLFIARDVRTGLLIVFGAVAFVLLETCVNIGALLVARAWTRQRELAIRKALGASTGRIVRQLLTESVLLALVGGTLGLVLAVLGLPLLRAIAPPGTPRLDRLELDRHVLWFTLGISLLSAILFGLLPAIQASSRGVGGVLRGGLAAAFLGSPTRRQALRGGLLIAEVALAVMLVVGGGLLALSFHKLMHVDIGVRTDHLLTMWVGLSDSSCDRKNPAACQVSAASVLERINGLPGVERTAVSGAGAGFLRGGAHYQSGIYVGSVETKQSFDGVVRAVTPDFFPTAGIRLLAGRDFAATDAGNASPVAIVSEGFTRRYLGGHPLGKRFSTYDDASGHPVWFEIVGEVNDTRDRAVTDPYGPVAYTPLAGWRGWTLLVRTSTDPASMVSGIERVVWSVDKQALITRAQTADQIISDSAAQSRFQTALLGSFSALGLLVAIVGVYGVISYSTLERTREIGVRIALGARASDVTRLVAGQGAALALVGILCGVAGALALTRFLRNMLFEVQPTDPATFMSVAVLLFVVALAACAIPARRAIRVDPTVALRHE
jgi:putative ABC transport system permease protein